MHVRKETENSKKGVDASSYSNTKDGFNSPLIKLPGTTTVPNELPPDTDPYFPNDTPVSPKLTPSKPPTGLLLPVFGASGTIYVVLVKPVVADSLIIVEQSNEENIKYNDKIDTKLLQMPVQSALPTNNLEALYNEARLIITTYATPAVALKIVDKLRQTNLEKVITNVNESHSIVSCAIKSTVGTNGEYEYNKAPVHYDFTYLNATDIDNMVFVGMYNNDIAEEVAILTDVKNTLPDTYNDQTLVPINFGLLTQTPRDLQHEAHYGNKSEITATTKLAFTLVGYKLVDEDSRYTFKYALAVLCQYAVTYVFEVGYGAHQCYTHLIDIKDGNEQQLLATVAYKKEDNRLNVKRFYYNYNGKVNYLCTVPYTAATTVLSAFDGNLFSVWIDVVFAEDETQTPKRFKVVDRRLIPNASYVNSYTLQGLTDAEVTALQPILTQLDKDKSEYSASIPTVATFNAYGFASLMVNSNSSYNQLTIKSVAIYV